MQNFSLLDYINKSNTIPANILDSMKFELNQHIYYYGDQFKYPKETDRNHSPFKKKIKRITHHIKYILNETKTDKSKITILSNAYFSVNAELSKIGYNVFCPCWWTVPNSKVLATLELYNKSEIIKELFNNESFAFLTSDRFIKIVNDFKSCLLSFYREKSIGALIVPNDMSFFENLSIQVCKELKIPTFIFLHGLPGRYNIIDENRSDYLIVWGEKIKDHYVQTGFNPEKILVSGHPYYMKLDTSTNLKFSLDNILVITKSMNGGQHGNEVNLTDRGNLILYLKSIQKVLLELGVTSARFRPHPCENPKWYEKFINAGFYKLDTQNLKESIQRSSLIIGPTSTVFLESLHYGVNYLIYEPSMNNIELTNYPLVPPFDGSDPRVSVATNERVFMQLLKAETKTNISVFNDYIKTPFDINFIKQLIH